MGEINNMNLKNVKKYQLDEEARYYLKVKAPRAALNTLILAVAMLVVCLLTGSLVDALEDSELSCNTTALIFIDIFLMISVFAIVVFTYNVMSLVATVVSVLIGVNYVALIHFGLPTKKIIENTNNLFTPVTETDNRTKAEEQYTLEYESAIKAHRAGKPIKIVCRHCSGVKLLGETCPYCGIAV